ncbi:hypothetical protein QQF64_028984 [Cirrhinus molitorella]|uniref:Uncharacterized protein n=2 Tax=Cirrhinus molitorella TaxID=172907 RepID=A0AA88PK65_9TELE|nr:hypothetical protein Q8A67_014373 [Cirrhinus molitorella]
MLSEKQAIPLRKFQSRQAEGECDTPYRSQTQTVFFGIYQVALSIQVKDFIVGRRYHPPSSRLFPVFPPAAAP